jgi:hypothetical protein
MCPARISEHVALVLEKQGQGTGPFDIPVISVIFVDQIKLRTFSACYSQCYWMAAVQLPCACLVAKVCEICNVA